MNQYTQALLRYTAAGLFLWFGITQLVDPGAWVGYLPEWIGYIPALPEVFVRLNGWFEVVLGVMLLLGLYTRVSALLLGVHLGFIAIEAGGAIGVRDAALALFTLTVAFLKPDAWTLDARLQDKPTSKTEEVKEVERH